MFGKIKKMFSEMMNPSSEMTPKKMAITDVRDLVGHLGVVYYNCDTNAWNRLHYNGYKIIKDDALPKRFKDAMEKIPEFSRYYEMVAPVTMTVAVREGNGELFLGKTGLVKTFRIYGRGQFVPKPQYSDAGTAVVGNVIVRNKNTGKYELYCDNVVFGWVTVDKYWCSPSDAAIRGAHTFTNLGAHDSEFRKLLILAHTR